MSQFRNTSDLVSSVLRRCGEPTDGTSLYATQAIDYLNQIHHTVITGGSEFNLEVDEPWVWARARRPLILEIQPYYNTGSVSLTQGSVSGTFSSAPAASLEGYFLKPDNGPEVYKVAQHTALSTSFQLDAAFPQTSVTGQTFRAYLLDYDLVGTHVVIDDFNDKLDFIVSGSSVITATLTHGTYSPSALATLAAAALHTADSARVYTGSYDSITRLYSLTSDLATSAVFKPQGASTNYYRSGWSALGFDYVNLSSAATQTSIYPHSTIVRMTQPGTAYYGSFFNYGQVQGMISGLDTNAFSRDYPLATTKMGPPSAFAIIQDKPDGTQRIRLNKYPDRKMRIEFEHVPVPKDLQNNSASIPLLPRKFIRVLEYGAAFYILTDKRDSKADKYFQIAQQTLQAMLKFNRKELERVGQNFGQIVARPDLMPDARHNRLNNYGYDAESL